MRILYIQASWVPPPDDLQADRFVFLSERLEGDVLQPLWFASDGDAAAKMGPDRYPILERGRFRYHGFPAHLKSGIQRRLSTLLFYLRKGLEIHRKRRYDCIVVYSHMMPAIAAIILKWLTGAKLIVEIMTAPDLSYLYERPNRPWWHRVMRWYSNLSLHLSVKCSDRVHLLYPTQLQGYPALTSTPASVFHDFVPVSLICPKDGKGERVILLVGAPWFLKGADLLIAAFRCIAKEFPDVVLRLQGHYPDADKLQALASGCPAIEIVKAVPNPETLRRIARALIVVHPSRCDGLARVLIEAMAAGVPTITSNAGGNPFCVRDGETSLVFPSGDVEALSIRLRQLLMDSDLRRKLGRGGYDFAHSQYSEKVYVEQFARMVESAVWDA